MSDLQAVDDIITCTHCGTRNRVGSYESTLRPVCGRCHSSLEPAIEAYKLKAPSPPKPFPPDRKIQRDTKIFIGVGVVFALLGFVLFQQSKPTPQKHGPSAPLPHSYADRESPPRRTSSPQQLPPTINRKLPNGTIIRSFSLHGLGQLTIKNGLSLDAAVKLVDKRDKVCKAYFYVRAYDQFTLPGINEGDYRLLFGIGEDWDQATEFFTRNQAFSEFNKPMDFVTFQEQRGDSIYENYTVMEVTLHPVPGGNIKTHTISAMEFQKY
jgi:hypothetical protein